MIKRVPYDTVGPPPLCHPPALYLSLHAELSADVRDTTCPVLTKHISLRPAYAMSDTRVLTTHMGAALRNQTQFPGFLVPIARNHI